MSITNLNTVSTPTTTTGVPTASAGTTTSSTAVSTTGTVGAPTSSSSTVTVTALMNKFEQGNMTVKDLVAELKYKGIASQVKTDDKFTSVTFKYSNKNYTIRSSNVNNESGTDSNKTTSYSDTTLRTTYKFSTEVINKYFDVCESYEDSAGKTTVTKYTIKENCGYSSPSALRTALYNEVKDQLILSTFLADKYDKNSTNSSLLTKVNSGKTNLSTTNYTTYADEIKKAAGDDVVKLKQDALNKVIKDFSCGNLVVQQLDTVLKSIGVENKTRTLTDGKYVVKFEFLGKNYQITCNQAAATKGGDTVHNKSYVFGSEFLSEIDSSSLEDVTKKYLFKIDDNNYRLKDELNLSDFLQAANLLGAQDLKQLEMQGIDTSNYTKMLDHDGNVVAYGSLIDAVEENDEMDIYSKFTVEDLPTPMLQQYFYEQVSENFYKLKDGITPDFVQNVIDQNIRSIYEIVLKDLETKSTDLYDTYRQARFTNNKTKEFSTSNNMKQVGNLLKYFQEAYTKVEKYSFSDAEEINNTMSKIVSTCAADFKNLEDFNSFYEILENVVTDENLKSNFKNILCNKFSNAKIESTATEVIYNAESGQAILEIIDLYKKGEISSFETEYALDELSSYNDTGLGNLLIENLIEIVSDKNAFNNFINDEKNQQIMNVLFMPTTTDYKDIESQYKNLIKLYGDETVQENYKQFKIELESSINENMENVLDEECDKIEQALLSKVNSSGFVLYDETKAIPNNTNITPSEFAKITDIDSQIDFILGSYGLNCAELCNKLKFTPLTTTQDAVKIISDAIRGIIAPSTTSLRPYYAIQERELEPETQVNIRNVFNTFLINNISVNSNYLTVTNEEVLSMVQQMDDDYPGFMQDFMNELNLGNRTLDDVISECTALAKSQNAQLTQKEFISTIIANVIPLEVDTTVAEEYVQKISTIANIFETVAQNNNGKFSIKHIYEACKAQNVDETNLIEDIAIAFSFYMEKALGISEPETIENFAKTFFGDKNIKANNLQEYLNVSKTIDISSYTQMQNSRNTGSVDNGKDYFDEDDFNDAKEAMKERYAREAQERAKKEREARQKEDESKWFNSDVAKAICDATNITTTTGKCVTATLVVIGVVATVVSFGTAAPAVAAAAGVIGTATTVASAGLNAQALAIESSREYYYHERANDQNIPLEERHNYKIREEQAARGRTDATCGLFIDAVTFGAGSGLGKMVKGAKEASRAEKVVMQTFWGEGVVNGAIGQTAGLANDRIYQAAYNRLEGELIKDTKKYVEKSDADKQLEEIMASCIKYQGSPYAISLQYFDPDELKAYGILTKELSDGKILFYDMNNDKSWTEESLSYDETQYIRGKDGFVVLTIMKEVIVKEENLRKKRFKNTLSKYGQDPRPIWDFVNTMQAQNTNLADKKVELLMKMYECNDISANEAFLADVRKVDAMLKQEQERTNKILDLAESFAKLGGSLEVNKSQYTLEGESKDASGASTTASANINIFGLKLNMPEVMPTCEEYVEEALSSVKSLYEHDKNYAAIDWSLMESEAEDEYWSMKNDLYKAEAEGDGNYTYWLNELNNAMIELQEWQKSKKKNN